MQCASKSTLVLSWPEIESTLQNLERLGVSEKILKCFHSTSFPFLLYCLWISLVSIHKYTPIVAVRIAFKNGGIFCLVQEKREMREKGARKEEKETTIFQVPTAFAPFIGYLHTAL